MKCSLAFDMGATSIRGILGYVENGKLVTEEILRFSHDRVKIDERSRWDWEKIINNISETIFKYKDKIESVGIDTWGVDFGILDIHGNLIENPISYRDPKNVIGYETAQKKMSLENIFMATGNQIMPINTLFQILALKSQNEKSYEKIDKILMIPDLVNFILCGKKYSEATISSTSQLFNLEKNEFSNEILEKFNIPSNFFAPVIEQGDILGTLKESKIEKLRELNIPVISVASHDTASAALLTKAFTDSESLFLSCGTWSLIGCVTEKPIITKEAFKNSLTNETGYGNSNMFFTNITGLYLLEKLKLQLEEKEQREISFEEINNYIKSNEKKIPYIDVGLPVFQGDEFDVMYEINKIIDKNLENPFDYFTLIYKSLAKKYNKVIKDIKNITKRSFKRIHVIGGGAKSELLCQMIADYTELEIIAGPFEATAYGNILIQQRALGKIKSIEEGFELISKSAKVYNYKPKNKF